MIKNSEGQFNLESNFGPQSLRFSIPVVEINKLCVHKKEDVKFDFNLSYTSDSWSVSDYSYILWTRLILR